METGVEKAFLGTSVTRNPHSKKCQIIIGEEEVTVYILCSVTGKIFQTKSAILTYKFQIPRIRA